jgi:hypothetical protein
LHDFRPKHSASSTGKIFTIILFNHFSPLALTPYLLVAEETLVDQTVGGPSPHHDSVPVSPRTQPVSPQPEISAHQEIIQFLLSQMYKSLPLSLRSFLLPFGKLGMM